MPHSLPVLIVDDMEICRIATALILREAGFSSQQAGSGHEALAKLKSGSYCAVIMDFHMPDMTGAECAEIIRSEEISTGTHLPIVGLTSNYSPVVENLCLAAGMNIVLEKSSHASGLLAALSAVMQTKAV